MPLRRAEPWGPDQAPKAEPEPRSPAPRGLIAPESTGSPARVLAAPSASISLARGSLGVHQPGTELREPRRQPCRLRGWWLSPLMAASSHPGDRPQPAESGAHQSSPASSLGARVCFSKATWSTGRILTGLPEAASESRRGCFSLLNCGQCPQGGQAPALAEMAGRAWQCLWDGQFPALGFASHPRGSQGSRHTGETRRWGPSWFCQLGAGSPHHSSVGAGMWGAGRAGKTTGCRQIENAEH